MKTLLPLLAVAMVASLTHTPTTEAYSAEYSNYLRSLKHFQTLSSSERKAAEEEFKVDTVFQIPTSNKPLLTEYYIDKSEEFGAYLVERTFTYDPYRLFNSKYNVDNRRYPATVLPEIRRGGTYYPVGARIYSEPKNVYYNPPVKQSNNPNSITLYSNFTSYPTYNSRW